MSTAVTSPPHAITRRRRVRADLAPSPASRPSRAAGSVLSAHTPREILVPLLTPILFAAVIAPALAKR